MSQPVVLKSNPHGINLILDDRIPFQELLDEILHKFKESDKFFKNARIALALCILDNNSLRDEICARKIQEFDESQSGRTGEFYKGTLRSGQVIECKTSIVVLGDVNPGAKNIAKGNIVVLGSLRGNAYAGAAGDEHTFVAALDMDPVQIKIGNVIGRSSDRGPLSAIKNRRKTLEPQVAVVMDDSILIEPITSGLLMNI